MKSKAKSEMKAPVTLSKGRSDIEALRAMTTSELETIVDKNMAAFILVGQALKVIRDERRYAPEFGSFGDYCRAKVMIGRQYGYRLITSSDIALEISPNGDRVLNEGQIRPLRSLKSAEARKEAFDLAVKSSALGVPLNTHVQNAVRDIQLRERVEAAAKAQSQTDPRSNTELSSKIIQGDSAEVDLLPAKSVHLILGSPPYNLGKSTPHHDDSLPHDEYLRKLENHLGNCHTWAVALGGRLAINVAIDTHRHGPVPLSADLIRIAQKVGWQYQATVVWDEGSHQAWLQDVDPVQHVRITCRCEVILIFSKGGIRQTPPQAPDITREELAGWSHGYWQFPGAHAADGHPCPYPAQIPHRLIKMLSYPGDVVLDPWCGRGTTPIEAKRLGRTGIGIDIEPSFCQVAERGLAETTNRGKLKKATKTTGTTLEKRSDRKIRPQNPMKPDKRVTGRSSRNAIAATPVVSHSISGSPSKPAASDVRQPITDKASITTA